MQHQKQLQDIMVFACCWVTSPCCSSSLGSRSCSMLSGAAGTAASATAVAAARAMVFLWDGVMLAALGMSFLQACCMMSGQGPRSWMACVCRAGIHQLSTVLPHALGMSCPSLRRRFPASVFDL